MLTGESEPKKGIWELLLLFRQLFSKFKIKSKLKSQEICIYHGELSLIGPLVCIWLNHSDFPQPLCPWLTWGPFQEQGRGKNKGMHRDCENPEGRQWAITGSLVLVTLELSLKGRRGLTQTMGGLLGAQSLSHVLYHCAVLSHSVMSHSLRPHGLQPLGSSVHGNSPGKNTGVGCHALLQEIFPTQGLNPGLPSCRQILYHLSQQESPTYTLLYVK